MKKTFLVSALVNLLIFSNPYYSSSQSVGVSGFGTVPKPSALLDVDADGMTPQKGMLVPRVALTSTTDVTTVLSPETSLMLYNSNASMTGGGLGYYFYNGSFWTPFTYCTGYDNLVVSSTSVSAISITADKIGVGTLCLSNINVSAAVTASGAGGLDAGSEASSTWYYIFIISNNSGSTINALLSTSSTAPTMPGGYTQKRRVGSVRNDGSGNFLLFDQEGNRVAYQENYIVLATGQATTFTDISCTAYIPPTSQRGHFLLEIWLSHNVVNAYFYGSLRKKGSSGARAGFVITSCPVANQFYGGETDCVIQTDASQVVQYSIVAVPTSGGIAVYVRGYYDRI